ncbi:cytochrome P450 [Coniella lustricola]|uniref:Cytochrome P450 n=1 Tax=Coniella lustricola TaxID=2025994 RepID=A0A2T3A560_9PEZI|nr:cytochrome P450 [Coniella lustricola]
MHDLSSLAHGFVAQVQQQPIAALIATLLVVCLTTRFVTGRPDQPQTSAYILDARTAPSVPYWIPYLGHLPRLALDPDGLLAKLKKLYPAGAFSLDLLGSTHTVVFTPSLTASLLDQPDNVVDVSHATSHLLQTVFGFSRSIADLALYDTLLKDLREQYNLFSSKQPLSEMVNSMTDRLRHNVAEFVTFNGSEIDQAHWERLASATLVEDPKTGEAVVEADMFELVRNFVALTANAALLGTDFVENYAEFWQALWRLDKGVASLAMDLPALLPINRAIGARRARGFLLRYLDEFETAMETARNGENPGPQWADVKNVSPLVQRRVDQVYRKHNVSIKQRSALDLALVWGLNANTNPLIFWLLWRLYSQSTDLLARVRTEIAPFVVLEKPAVGFGAAFGTATRIEKIDSEGLLNNCPLLKASYLETLRLDQDAWSFHSVREDTVVGDREGNKVFLRAGTFAHAAPHLWHRDAQAYDEPDVWRPERHLKPKATNEKQEHEQVANLDNNLKPYGRVITEGKEQPFIEREVLLFAAAIIAMYDIQPQAGAPWNLPKRETTAGAKHPLLPVNVWIRSRPMPSEHEHTIQD